MEAQYAILRGYIHGAIPSLETRKNHVFTKLPKSFEGFSLKIRFPLQPYSFITKRGFQCRSSIERDEKNECKGVSDAEEDKPKSKIKMKNLAVFVSGGGSNFRSIYKATLNGSIHGRVVALVSNKHDCGGAEFAREKGIPVILFPPKKDANDVFW